MSELLHGTTTLLRITVDGRRIEVIGRQLCIDGKAEADALLPVAQHPNRAAILSRVPEATHVAGRIVLDADEAARALTALDAARLAYETSPAGIAARIRNAMQARDRVETLD